MSEQKIAYHGPTVKAFARLAPVLALYTCTAPGTCDCGSRDKCKTPGKHPNGRIMEFSRKWKAGQGERFAATQDQTVIDGWIKKAEGHDWELNWALTTGKAFGDQGYWLIVVDVDPRNGGDETLGRYEAQYGKLPHTWTTLTGGGGQHYYFKVKLPVAPATVAVVGGIEIKGEGGYVVIPPSMHASGKRYEWDVAATPGPDMPLAEAPGWVVDLLCGTGTAPARKITHGPATADPAATLIGHAMGAAGMHVGPHERTGIRFVECPWADEHSDGRGRGEDSSSALLVPTLETPTFGGWRCQHAHCVGRGVRALLDKLPIEAWRDADEHYPRQLGPTHRERLGFPPDDLLPEGQLSSVPAESLDFDDDDFPSDPPPFSPVSDDENAPLAPAPRPIIRVAADMARLCREIRSALGGDHLAFCQGEVLVAIRGKSIMVCKPGTIQELIDHVADVEKYDARSRSWVRCVLPKEVCTTVLESASIDGFPTLKGIATLPYVGPKGDLVREPGFHPGSGYFLLDSEDLRKVETPTELTQRDAVAAMQVLRDVTCDIPFANDVHAYGWLAMLLTMLARPTIDGCTPLFAFDASAPGSGKTILVRTAALVAYGREYLCSAGIADQVEEMRKAITTTVLAGNPIMLLDNYTGVLRSPPLEAALTTRQWEDRLLASNLMVSAPMQTIFAITGNNLKLGNDISRRAFVCRLEPDRPINERGNFRHGELDTFARKHRFELYSAALTILAAHAAAGSPEADVRPRPGFEEWSRRVASAIVWAGGPDVTGLFADEGGEDDVANDEEGARSIVVEQLSRMYPETEFSARDLYDRLWGEQNQRGQWVDLVDALDMLRPGLGSVPWSVKTLGYVLRDLRSRPVAGRRLVARRSRGTNKWVVERYLRLAGE